MIERNFEEKYKQKCNEISALKDSYEYALAELKQQLHYLPKKIVEEIIFKLNEDMTIAEDYFKIRKILDTILKKYGDI